MRVKRTGALSSCADVVIFSQAGQKDPPLESIASFMSARPGISGAITLVTHCVLASIPVYTLTRAARPSSSQTRKIEVSALLTRALTFGILATFSLLHVLCNMLLKHSSSESSRLSFYISRAGLDDLIGLARLCFGLGVTTWVIARIARLYMPKDRPTFRGEAKD